MLNSACITVKGESNDFTLVEIFPFDQRKSMAVSAIIAHACWHQDFENVDEMALRLDNGINLHADDELCFADDPVVHMFSVKDPVAKANLKYDYWRVFFCARGGPCYKERVKSKQPLLLTLHAKACASMDLNADEYTIEPMEHQAPFDFFLKFIE
jgi:hypothetical protein